MKVTYGRVAEFLVNPDQTGEQYVNVILNDGTAMADDSSGNVVVIMSGLEPGFTDEFRAENPWVEEWCKRLEGAPLSCDGFSIRDGTFILNLRTTDGFRLEVWTNHPVELTEG